MRPFQHARQRRQRERKRQPVGELLVLKFFWKDRRHRHSNGTDVPFIATLTS